MLAKLNETLNGWRKAAFFGQVVNNFISVEEIIKFVAFIHLADPPQTNIAKIRYGTEIGGINKAEFKDLQVPSEQQVWEPLFGLPPISGIFGTGGRKKTRSRKHKRKTRRH